jgi:type II secretory pathway pseudopilin PulG
MSTRNPQQPKPHKEAGFTLPGVLASIIIFLMMLPMLTQLIDDSLERIRQRAVATHLSSVVAAVSKYTKEHYAELAATASATQGTEVDFATLRTEGFLTDTFNSVNPWGQTYKVFVFEPAQGSLQPVVLTYGGRTYSPDSPKFANTTVPATAALSGGDAGFIPTGTLPGQSNEELRGIYSGWVFPLAGTNVPVPEPGHIGAMVFMDDRDIRQDYLYRFEIPGKPELNEMYTELDMTDHAIRNVDEVQFTKHDTLPADFCNSPEDEGRVFLHNDYVLYLCRDQKAQTVADTGNTDLVRTTALAANGDRFKKPECPEGTNTAPAIFVSPTIVAEKALAKPIVTFQSWSLDLGDEWEVKLRVKTDEDEGYQFPTSNYARMNVQTFCAKEANN